MQPRQRALDDPRALIGKLPSRASWAGRGAVRRGGVGGRWGRHVTGDRGEQAIDQVAGAMPSPRAVVEDQPVLQRRPGKRSDVLDRDREPAGQDRAALAARIRNCEAAVLRPTTPPRG